MTSSPRALDPRTIATDYLATWNAADPGRRQSLLGERWQADACYADPVMRGDGIDQIAGLIAAVQQRFPTLSFTLRGEPDGFGDQVRFSWSLGEPGADAVFEGTDFVELSDGRIARVTGFIDKAPAG